MAASAHVASVRSLYKRILVLHRFLPIDLKALGDQYVKDEFRRHKSASAEEVKKFMTEWQVNDSRHTWNIRVVVQQTWNMCVVVQQREPRSRTLNMLLIK